MAGRERECQSMLGMISAMVRIAKSKARPLVRRCGAGTKASVSVSGARAAAAAAAAVPTEGASVLEFKLSYFPSRGKVTAEPWRVGSLCLSDPVFRGQPKQGSHTEKKVVCLTGWLQNPTKSRKKRKKRKNNNLFKTKSREGKRLASAERGQGRERDLQRRLRSEVGVRAPAVPAFCLQSCIL